MRQVLIALGGREALVAAAGQEQVRVVADGHDAGGLHAQCRGGDERRGGAVDVDHVADPEQRAGLVGDVAGTDAERFLESSGCRWLAKPFRLRDLLRLARETLR